MNNLKASCQLQKTHDQGAQPQKQKKLLPINTFTFPEELAISGAAFIPAKKNLHA